LKKEVSFFSKQTRIKIEKTNGGNKMRNKIKQLLKKEGGFTLVELLGVIVILGLIIGISIPLIGNIINNSEETIDKQQQELVIDAAQMYFLQDGKGKTTTNVEELETTGYLEAKEASELPNYTVTKDGNEYKISED